MANLPVKWFHNGMAGAPVLSGTAGAMLAVLSACLVDGFNLVTLTGLTVAANVVTASKASHGFVVDQVVEIAGATPAELNGQWRVASVPTTGTFTFATSGISDQAATGTITAKTPGAGWNKAFSGTNKAAFVSLENNSNKNFLRVDDTGTTTARVRGYSAMTGVDTGSNPFPTDAQVSGGGYWFKSTTADSAARTWYLVADGKSFYFIRMYSPGGPICGDCFAEFTSEKSGDPANFYMTCHTTTAGLGGWEAMILAANGNYSVSLMRGYSPRQISGMGGSYDSGAIYGCYWVGNQYSGGYNASQAYPSPASMGLIVTRCVLYGGAGMLRCLAMPGIFHSPQDLRTVPALTIVNVPSFSNRKLLCLPAITQEGGAYTGRLFFDITGPWS